MKNIMLVVLSLAVCVVACREEQEEKFRSRWEPGSERELIAFIRDGRIHLMNPDGSNVRLQGYGGVRVGGPMAWSPDGSSIAYWGDNPPVSDLMSHLYIMNSKGVVNKPMDVPCYPVTFTWSPDSKRLAFDSQHETFNGYPAFRIFIIGLDSPVLTGTNPVADTLVLHDTNPSWSPDGEKIAFTSNRARDGWWDIYVMNPDGSDIDRITESPIYKFRPVWSPDGEKIAFDGFGSENNSWSIYIMDRDGSNLFQVTHNLSYEVHMPTWSPDGSRLAFVSNHEGNKEIYVINTDGTGLGRLTNYEGEDYSPSWSRGKM